MTQAPTLIVSPVRPMLAALSLCRRELVRFLRQRNRVIGALATPIVFWLLIGAGMGRSFQTPGIEGGYIEYFFPGTIVMILLFTAIFSTISVIEDRREGFLQSVLVSPAPRQSIVLGKLLGGTILATGQGMLFLLLAPLVGIGLGAMQIVLSLGMMLIVSFALTGLGFCIAWLMNSTHGFHAIMNLFLMPMWLLSGAIFPATGAAGVVQLVMAINPLTYCLSALRSTLYWGNLPQDASAVSIGPSLAVSVFFAIAMFALSIGVARGRERIA